jgi:hypothetical protein
VDQGPKYQTQNLAVSTGKSREYNRSNRHRQPLWKTTWRLLKKLEIDLPYFPTIPLLGTYSKECESGYNKALAHPCLLQHYSQ